MYTRAVIKWNLIEMTLLYVGSQKVPKKLILLIWK